MSDALNIPIQMIFVSNTVGNISPLRFRYEAPDHTIIKVDIQETISSKEINFAGIRSLMFLCKAEICDEEKLFELRYTILSHTWILFRIHY